MRHRVHARYGRHCRRFLVAGKRCCAVFGHDGATNLHHTCCHPLLLIVPFFELCSVVIAAVFVVGNLPLHKLEGFHFLFTNNSSKNPYPLPPSSFFFFITTFFFGAISGGARVAGLAISCSILDWS